MIRFIDLGFQMWLSNSEEDGAVRQFAFFDTCVDKFVDLDGTQVWGTWAEFAEDHRLYMRNDAQSLERFWGLCATWAKIPGPTDEPTWDIVLTGGDPESANVMFRAMNPAAENFLRYDVRPIRAQRWNETSKTLMVAYDTAADITVQATRLGFRVGPPA